jgi:hypothetical protein
MPAPSQDLRIVRLDLQTSRECGNRLAELPGARLGHAEVDDARNVLRVGLECGSRGLDEQFTDGFASGDLKDSRTLLMQLRPVQP